MSLLARLFGKTDASPELLCPHCERAMDAGHDADACARKGLSRRFFFGVLGGAAVAAAMPAALVESPLLPGPGILRMAGLHSGNVILTSREFAQMCLEQLRTNLYACRLASNEYSAAFDRAQKVGDTITIRNPLHFLGTP